MQLIDLITTVGLVIGLILTIVVFSLIRQSKLKPEMFPRVLGIGTTVYGFALLMTASLLLRPLSDFINYTLTNYLLVAALGIVAYISGYIMKRRQKNR